MWKNTDIKVSNTKDNPNRLFYTCREKKCDFFQWHNPINANIFVSCKFKNIVTEEVEKVSRKKSNT